MYFLREDGKTFFLRDTEGMTYHTSTVIIRGMTASEIP